MTVTNSKSYCNNFIYVIKCLLLILLTTFFTWSVTEATGSSNLAYSHDPGSSAVPVGLEKTKKVSGQISEIRQIRIFTGGIRHESNTFIPHLTKKELFTIARGQDALYNQPWAEYLKGKGVEVIPSLHAYTRPYGVIARDAYEEMKAEILEGARKAGDVDGVYLDLHGAMQVEGYHDAQLDLVTSVKEILGDDILVSASFDLHGNMLPEFLDELDVMANMRTAPHVDGPETRKRAVRLLLEAIENDMKPVIAHINVPIVIPGEMGITSVEPWKSLYDALPVISEREGFMEASIFIGMPWTDVYQAGVSVQVVAENQDYYDKAMNEARRLAGIIWDRRHQLGFDVPTDDIDGAIQTALNAPESTVFITDSGDNTTAGAAGDGTLVLSRLIEHDVPDAVLAGIVDPEAVTRCIEAGVGARVNFKVGGKVDTVFSEPYEIEGIVRTLKTEDFEREALGRGRRLNGKAAVVDLGGVLLVLLEQRQSFTSPEMFYDVDIDPLEHKIVVVKLGYLFQALRDIAPRTIMALTPGFAYQVVEKLDYQKIRRPVFPLDRDMEWTVPNK